MPHLSHTFAQNVIHVVFSTKDRRKAIPEAFQSRLWAYAAGICHNLGIFVHAIGGMDDHIHFLIQVPPSLSVAKAVLTIKSNSSRWAHEEGHKFAWQQGYGAFSVSASNLQAVSDYIRAQAMHHARHSFEQEFFALLTKHGIEFTPERVFG